MHADLLIILRDANILNQEGEPITDFENRGRDALDFTSVNRSTLKALLEAAYKAGNRTGYEAGCDGGFEDGCNEGVE